MLDAIADYWLLLLTSVLVGILTYFYYNLTYFKRYGIAHLTPWPFVGNTGMMKGKHFIEYISYYSDLWPDHKYVGIQVFRKNIILIRDVELVKEITIKSFEHFHDHDSFISEDTDPLFGKGLFSIKGKRWKETRMLLSPAFTGNKMRQMFDLMAQCARNISQYIHDSANRGVVHIDMKDMCTRYTVDVIASCAFGISINSVENPDNEFFVLGRKAMKTSFIRNMKMILSKIFPFLPKFINLQIIDTKLTNFFCSLIKETIETRKREGIVRPDMLQLMLESSGKNGNVELDIFDMTAQAFVFFVGGFETTSSLMAFTVVELSRNSKVQERLLEEIDEAMDKCNGNPTYEVINSLPYLEAVLYETLRYYPVVGLMDRLCERDFELPPAVPGAKPYTLKKGEVVWIASHAIHNDPRIYENPTEFDPDRFLSQKVHINLPTFLAFGCGPRSCIGNRFALLENKLFLFHLLTKCRIEQSSKLQVPITYDVKSIPLIIKGGFWIKIVNRK